MPTQNRFYTNLGQATFLANPSGMNLSETDLQAASTTGWSTQFPFVIRVEPGTANEELMLATAGAGTSASPFVVERGFDSTTPKVHAANVPIVPGICQLDLAEPQQHLNLTGSSSAAHGLPASAWNGGTLQIIEEVVTNGSQTNIPFTVPSGYDNLEIMVTGRSGVSGTTIDTLNIQFNGYTGSTHYGAYYGYNNSVVNGSYNTASSMRAGPLMAAGVTEGVTRTRITITSCSDTVWRKGILYQASGLGSTTSTFSESGTGVALGVAGAVTSILLYATSATPFPPNCKFTLYGF